MRVEMCACGRVLHYNSPDAEAAMRRIITLTGEEFANVHCGGKSWRVQKHYIALHGLKAQELDMLAAMRVIEQVG